MVYLSKHFTNMLPLNLSTLLRSWALFRPYDLIVYLVTAAPSAVTNVKILSLKKLLSVAEGYLEVQSRQNPRSKNKESLLSIHLKPPSVSALCSPSLLPMIQAFCMHAVMTGIDVELDQLGKKQAWGRHIIAWEARWSTMCRKDSHDSPTQENTRLRNCFPSYITCAPCFCICYRHFIHTWFCLHPPFQLLCCLLCTGDILQNSFAIWSTHHPVLPHQQHAHSASLHMPSYSLPSYLTLFLEKHHNFFL